MFFKKEVIENNVLKKMLEKDRVKRYMFLIVGCFLLAVSFNVFFKPNNIVTGGISGVGIVIENLFNFSAINFIIISYIVLLIVSYFILGKKMTRYSLIGSICYPLFVYLTQNFVTYMQFDVENLFLVTLFGALISGLGSGLTFKYGFSTGGVDIVGQIMSKYFKISLGDSIKIINIIIILGSGFFIGTGIYAWENVMYAIITVYIINILNNKVLLEISSSKAFYIITENETDIKRFLINELGKGVTILEGRGGYTGDRKKVIMCAIPTKEYFLAKECILEIDKDAIILINDVYQSSGIE